MDRRYIEPYKDMYNIYNLITKINKNYRLYYDKKHKCFLIINLANNYEVCLKFSSFSQNIIKILQKTQISNACRIFKEIEENNEVVFKQKEREIQNKVSNKIEEVNWLVSRKNKILKSDINKIIEV